MANNRLILRTLNSPWVVSTPDLTRGSVLTHSDVDNNFIYLKGESIYNVTSSPDNITLNKVNGTSLTIGFTSTTNSYTSGTTVVGNTIYFDRNDTLSAYTADLSSVLSGVTLTDGNGTTASGSSTNLGGTLTSNAIISGGGKNLELGTSANLLNDVKVNSVTGSDTYSGVSSTNIELNTPASFDRKVTDGDAVTLFEGYSSSLDLKTTKPTLSGESRVYITPETVEITQTNTSTNKGSRLQFTPNSSDYTYTDGANITSQLFISSTSANFTINEIGGGNSGLIIKPEESLIFTDNSSLKLTPSATTFTDTRVTTKGIEYAADYSTGWTANSLVTKGYVDSTNGVMPANSFKANITNSVATPTDVTEGDLTSVLPDSADGILGFDTATNSIVRFPASKLLNVMFSGLTTASSLTISADSVQLFFITTLSQNLTINVPSGTPTESQQLIIRLKDNGTARTITWNAIFTGSANIPLPTTTIVGQTDYFTFIFNGVTLKWELIQSTQTSGGGTPTLNNGEVFVGNVSNVATSVAMTGDTLISNTGVVTIQSDVVTYDKMQDTTQAALLGNQTTGGGTVEEIPIIEQYITDATAIGLLIDIANWDVNGNYTGTSITGTFQGQSHYNGNYWFTAVADNDWIRLIRG
tara:strand:- start:761 stop:2680 length:1920 start_codon:yes stop_codon:yes gene_type:complete